MESVNAKGGINGAKVQVILLDDECKPDKGVANVNRFIHQNKVHLILGSTCSSVTMPIADITAKEQVPQIVPMSTNSSITQKGSEWIFRVSVSERFYAGAYGKYLGENVGKNIAYLYTTDGAGIAFVKQLQDYMKEHYKAEPVYQVQMQETDLDFRSHLLKIKSTNPQILAIAGQSDALARQAQQSFEVGIPKSVWRVAASSAGNVTYPKLAGDAAIGTTFTQAFNCADERPIARQFVAMVKEKYKFSCPDHDFSQAWDAAQIALVALGKANLKLTDAALADDRRAIRDALATIRYEGLAGGPIEFCAAPTPQCRDGNRTAMLVQYTKGGENFETKVVGRVSFDKDFGLPK
jgi:branched-chain amino acid transport system substrate-binding protein